KRAGPGDAPQRLREIAPPAPLRRGARTTCTAALLLYAAHQVGTACLAHLGLDGQVITEGVVQLERVELLGEADAVAHVQSRRQVAADHQGSLVGDVGLETHVFYAHARAELLREDRAALRQRRTARAAAA